jgi:8-oxo-dGTP pyrophosphatase MutT (NUDIX family)
MPKPQAKQSTAARMAPGQRPQVQVAALCWRRSAKGLRVLLITSRDTGRWVIPKGWPMRNRSDAEAAAREAYEEAGLRGEVSPRSLGIYTYQKALGSRQSIPVVVRVFPLEAREMLRTYPETGQRRVKWFPPDKAAQRVAEPDLAALIRGFSPDNLDGTPEAAPEAATNSDEGESI